MVANSPLRHLTQKIVLGVAIGGVPMMTVGCVQPPAEQPMVSAPAVPEREALSQAMASRDPQAVDAFLAAHPRSRYSASLLNAMPPSVLACLSKEAVAGLSAATRSHLTRTTRAALSHAMCDANGETAVPASAPAPSVDDTSRPASSRSRGSY